MLNGRDQVICGMPIDSAISRGIAPRPGIGTQPRYVPFGGGSDTDSDQSTVSKDNKAILEGEGLNVVDGSTGVRDDGILAQNHSSVLRQSGITFHGARKTAIEPGSAALIAGGVVLSVYLYSKK